MRVSAWRDSPRRPEGSAHNTSFASSVDGADNHSDGIFSEDESVDSIDIGNDACGLRDGAKVVPSVKNLTYSTRGNGNISKQSSTCKPYVDCYHNKRPHADDDDDDCQEEGRWAQEPHRSVVYNEDVRRKNISNHGHKTSSHNAAQGKRRSLRMNGNEERRRWISDLYVTDDRVDGQDISAPKKSEYRYSTDGKDLPYETRQAGGFEIIEPVNSSSHANTRNVIDVHIKFSDRRDATSMERKGSSFDENRKFHRMRYHKEGFPQAGR